jgi:type VI protein secretion system component VasF
MSERTEQLLAEIGDTLRRQLANQERALAQQEEAVAMQRDALARQRSGLTRVWRLVILVLVLIAITYGITILQWYSRR